MSQIHHKIVQEIIQECKKDKNIIAINIMGSVSRDEERPNSDVDIEIVTIEKKRKFSWKREKRYGIDIDIILSSQGQIAYQIDHYPFFLLHKDKMILYDPTGFMMKIKARDLEYMGKHPQIKRFWEEKYQKMKEKKAKGEQKESLRDIFNQAEILFSDEHIITRDWFRK